jgi:3',5'-cyclic AMP phosphodiesterase CpdA
MKASFIADTHIHTKPEDNEILKERLGQLDPNNILVILGDITDNGIEAEYKEAFRLLKPWKSRIVLAPGNHDTAGLHGLRWSEQAAARWTKFVCQIDAVADIMIGDTYVCALDSVNPRPNILELAQGELGEAELNRAKEAIGRARMAGKKVCLCMHHTPVDNPRTGTKSIISESEAQFMDWAEKLRDSSEFLAIAYGGEGADLILCGHTHIHLEWTATTGIPTHIISLADLRSARGLDTFVLA